MSDVPHIGHSEFDHHSETQLASINEIYNQLRQECPFGHSSKHGGFFFTLSNEGVKQVAGDYRSFTTAKGNTRPAQPIALYPLVQDPPEHQIIRRHLNSLLSVPSVQTMRGTIASAINERLDGVIDRTEVDLAAEVIYPALPAIILPVVGIPLADLSRVAEAATLLSRGRVSSPEDVRRAAGEVIGYLRTLVARTRLSDAAGSNSGGQDTLLHLLLGASNEEAFLTDEVIASALLFLITAGLNTTAVAVLDAVIHLCSHPEDLERLLSGDVKWSVGIEEILRVYPPVTAFGRTALRDIEVDRVLVREGSFVMAVNGAANRDPAAFDAPNEFILDRSPNPHVSFGFGPHLCAGRHLARAEIEVMLPIIFQRLPDLKVKPGHVLHYSAGEGRALTSLPVIFGRSATPSPGRT